MKTSKFTNSRIMSIFIYGRITIIVILWHWYTQIIICKLYLDNKTIRIILLYKTSKS
jgi:hypothetical protein